MSSSSSSTLLLLLYGIFLCNFFASLPVISSNRQSIHNASPFVWTSSSSCDKRQVTSRDEEYLLGIKRLRKLYCNVGIGFHIQVLANGKITGIHNENRYSKYILLFRNEILCNSLSLLFSPSLTHTLKWTKQVYFPRQNNI